MINPILVQQLIEHVPELQECSGGDKAAKQGLATLAQELGGTLKGQTVSWRRDGVQATFTWSPGNSQGFVCQLLGGSPGTIEFTKRFSLDRWLAPFVARAPLSNDDPRFDHDIRVNTRDVKAARALLLKPKQRRALRAPLDRGLCRVVFDEKGVALHGNRSHVGAGHPTAEHVLPLVAELRALRRGFPVRRHFAKVSKFDRTLVLAWVCAVTTFLFGLIGIGVSESQWPLVDGTAMLPATLSLAALSIPLAWGAMTRLFGHYSSPERIVFGLSLFWVPALPLGIVGLSLLLNGGLDHSEPTFRTETIVDKVQWTNDKGRLRSRAGITPHWLPGETWRFAVSSSAYEKLVVGQSQLVVPTHPGALGWLWNEPISIAQPDSSPTRDDGGGD